MKVKDIKKHLTNLTAFRSKELKETEMLVLRPGKIYTGSSLHRYSVDFGHDVRNAIDFDKFKKIIMTLDADDVIGFVHNPEKKHVYIKVNNVVQFKFPEENGGINYPELTPEAYQVSIGNISKEKHSVIKEALDFVGNDDLRPAMTGVFLSNKMAIATDGHRMFFDKLETVYPENAKVYEHSVDPELLKALGKSMYEISDEEKEAITTKRVAPHKGIILPKAICTAIIAQKQDVELISFSKSAPRIMEATGEEYGDYSPHVLIKGNGFEITTNPIDERFPDYWNVIPNYEESNHLELIVPTTDFLKNVKLADIAANVTTHQVGIHFNHEKKDVVKLHSEDLDYDTAFTKLMKSTTEVVILEPLRTLVSESGEETLQTPDTFEWFKAIGFNARLLTSILKLVDTKFVSMKFSAPNRATVINGKYLLMPVMLNDYNS